ncbi:MAG: leucine-rich repeat protein [Tannerella sp.]|nr:leucine-rich repeat protein [Tannerella sp.]
MSDYSSYAATPWSSATGINGVRNVVIQSGVTSIGKNAFNGATHIWTVSIPNSVTTIGDYAFHDCSGFQGALTISNSVITIGKSAFMSCSQLTSVSFGTSLKHIEQSAFQNCSGLVGQLTIPDGVEHLGPFAFAGCSNITSVKLGNSVGMDNLGTTPRSQFNGCSKLASVTFPNSIYFTSIDERMFYGCGITGPLTIPNSVTTIGESAFKENTKITYVTFPNSLRTMNEAAFMGCTGLVGDLIIPNSVTTLKAEVFSGCTGISSVIIGDGITTIPEKAFDQCTGLTSLTVGSAVTDIEQSAFYSCSDISAIKIMAALPAHNNSGLTSLDANTPVTVLCSLTGSGPWLSHFTNLVGEPYKLSVFSNIPAAGEVTKTDPTCPGNTATITATPRSGARFVDWDDGDTNDSRTVTLASDSAITARFVYTYNIQAVPNESGRGTVSGGAIYDKDAPVTLTATSSGTDYSFAKWSDGNTNATRSFTATADVSLVAYFDVLHTVTAASADASMGAVTGGGTYKTDSTYTITATPEAHHSFVQWDDGNTDNPRHITITATAPSSQTYTATFAPIMHDVTIVSGDVAKGSVAPTYSTATSVQEGTSIPNILASAGTGYCFVRWSDGNTDNPRTITVMSDMVLTAIFDLVHHRLTLTVENPTMGTVTGSGDFVEYSSVNFSATPNAGYSFVRWHDGNVQNPRTISLACDTAFTAVFSERLCNLTVTTNDPAMGKVTGSTQYRAHLEEAIIVAIPEPGYRFRYWSDRNAENPRTIDFLTDTTLRAEFEPIPYHSVTVQPNHTGMGQVTGGGGTVADGSAVTLQAVPATGYRFVQWSDGNIYNPRDLTVTQPVNLTAVFEAIPEHHVSVLINDPIMGTVVGEGDFSTGQTALIGVIPATGYRFVRWDDGNTQNPRAITVTGDMARTAVCEVVGATQSGATPHQVTVFVNNPSWGTVIGGGHYADRATVLIGAVPHTGYRFVQWSDGNTQNPRQVNVTQDAVFLAVIESVAAITETEHHVTVYVNNPSWGTVLGGGDYKDNTLATIGVVPDPGYRFVRWSDGNTQNPRTIKVTQDVLYIAVFESATGLFELPSASDLRVVSHPATGDLTVFLPETVSGAELILYSLQGQAVLRRRVASGETVSGGSLSPGIYIYQLITDGQTGRGKVHIRR